MTLVHSMRNLIKATFNYATFSTCGWLPQFSGERCGAVGWGTTLQTWRVWVRFPMMLLEFFNRPHNDPGVESAWGIKAAGVYSWQPYHLHVPTVSKCGSLKTPGNVRGCNRHVQGLLYRLRCTTVRSRLVSNLLPKKEKWWGLSHTRR